MEPFCGFNFKEVFVRIRMVFFYTTTHFEILLCFGSVIGVMASMLDLTAVDPGFKP